MVILERHLYPRVIEALDTFRVVLIHGPRQCGKTALAQIIAAERGGRYVTLDDEETLQAARDDPLGLLSEGPYPLVVDEVQRGGDDLVRKVKQIVDRSDERGRFLLTGSSDFLTVPTVSESLAGRVGVLKLWPLSEAEIENTPSTVVDQWFETVPSTPSPARMPEQQLSLSVRRDCLERLCRGGYPDARNIHDRQRRTWATSYIDTVIRRDLRDATDLRKAAVLPSLLRWASSVSDTPIITSKTAKKFEMSWQTTAEYLDWLKMVFLLHDSPAWWRNVAKRETRRAKTYATDTGVTTALLGLTADQLESPTAAMTGTLLETFVFNEILRQVSSAPDMHDVVHHYCDRRDHEVDILLEGPGGAVIAIEVRPPVLRIADT